MAAGRAVVAEDVGDVRRLVGSAGRLVRAGDVSGFVTAVKELLANEAARNELGATAAQRAATELSWDGRAPAWNPPTTPTHKHKSTVESE